VSTTLLRLLDLPDVGLGSEEAQEAQPGADDEEADDPADETTPTLDQLRTTGDPNEVGRTPVLGSSDIPVEPGAWPLGFPLQGVPRVAVTLSLSHVYNPDKERWERDTGNSGGPNLAQAGAFIRSTGQTFQPGSAARVQFNLVGHEKNMTVDAATNTITVSEDGIYQVHAELYLVDHSDNHRVFFEVTTTSGFDVVRGQRVVSTDPFGFPDDGFGFCVARQIDAGEEIYLRIFNDDSDPLQLSNDAQEVTFGVIRVA